MGLLAACFTVHVLGASMAPTLQHGAFYEYCDVDTVKRNDIVVFNRTSNGRPEVLVKRVTGVPGDSLGVTFGLGVPKWEIAKVIPLGYYHVQSDNLSSRWDSRRWGLISKEQIRGTVFGKLNKQGKAYSD